MAKNTLPYRYQAGSISTGRSIEPHTHSHTPPPLMKSVRFPMGCCRLFVSSFWKNHLPKKGLQFIGNKQKLPYSVRILSPTPNSIYLTLPSLPRYYRATGVCCFGRKMVLLKKNTRVYLEKPSADRSQFPDSGEEKKTRFSHNNHHHHPYSITHNFPLIIALYHSVAFPYFTILWPKQHAW